MAQKPFYYDYESYIKLKRIRFALDQIKEKARIAFTANLSSFFAASDITAAPWVLFQASSSVASLLSLSLSTSNGLEKGPFFLFSSRMLGSRILGFL